MRLNMPLGQLWQLPRRKVAGGVCRVLARRVRAVADKNDFTEAMRTAGWQVFRQTEVAGPMYGYGYLAVQKELPVQWFLVTSGFRRLQEKVLEARYLFDSELRLQTKAPLRQGFPAGSLAHQNRACGSYRSLVSSPRLPFCALRGSRRTPAVFLKRELPENDSVGR
jgi:hypothetical protein